MLLWTYINVEETTFYTRKFFLYLHICSFKLNFHNKFLEIETLNVCQKQFHSPPTVSVH